MGRLFMVHMLFLIAATSILSSNVTMTDDTKEAGAINDDRYVHINSKYCIGTRFLALDYFEINK